jgi:predicted metal-dependent hydrolase
MENEKTVSYSEIGDVRYRRNSRAKNISIRISPDGVVRVTVPGRCSFHRAERFVMEKRNWIHQKTLKIKRLKEKNLVWRAGDMVPLRNRVIVVMQGAGSKFIVNEVDGGYEIGLPAGYDPVLPAHQAALKELVARIGLKEAKRQLPGILAVLSAKHALPYARLTVRRMRTRWGSCSSKNNISLNSGLIFLPDSLIEYVMLHELVHTVNKDHSKRFWNALEARLPGALTFRKELRNSTIIA